MSTIHDNIPPKKINNQANEQEPEPNEKRRRALVMPPEIVDMIVAGTITFNDFRIAMCVDNYVDYKGSGCWASIGHLANKLDLSQNYVGKRIRYLRELGIIKQIGTVTINNWKRNLLETIWSRLFPDDPDNRAVQKRVAREIREHVGHDNVKVKIDGSRVEESDFTATLARWGTATLESLHNNSSTSYKRKEEKPRSRFSSPQVTGFSFVNGTDKSKSKSKTVTDKKYRPDLEKLNNVIRTAQPAVAVAPVRLADNLDALRLLIEKDLNGNYKAFTTVLEDYGEYINAIEKGPTIDSAVKFRKHFNWIRDLCNKEKGDVVLNNGSTYTGE
jgi:DNA-binding Lrp family transcriptional regulator